MGLRAYDRYRVDGCQLNRLVDNCVRGASAVTPNAAQSGQRYAVTSGVIGVGGGEMYQVSAGTSFASAVVDMPCSDDFFVELKNSVYASGEGSIVLKCDGTDSNKFFVYWYIGTIIEVVRRNGGANNASWSAVGLTIGSNDVIAAHYSQGVLKVYQNGTLRLTTTADLTLQQFNKAGPAVGGATVRHKNIRIGRGLP